MHGLIFARIGLHREMDVDPSRKRYKADVPDLKIALCQTIFGALIVALIS